MSNGNQYSKELEHGNAAETKQQLYMVILVAFEVIRLQKTDKR